MHEDKTISMYDETADDDIYGGYEREPTVWDKEAVSKPKKREYQRIREGETISLHVFADGNSLETDGYELFYVVKGVGAVKLTLVETVDTIRENYVASGIDYIFEQKIELDYDLPRKPKPEQLQPLVKPYEDALNRLIDRYPYQIFHYQIH